SWGIGSGGPAPIRSVPATSMPIGRTCRPEEPVMLRWFHALMPREERFFDLFARHSETIVAGAHALRAMLEGGEAVSQHYKTVMDREHDADNITREVLIAVRRTF